MNEFNPQIEKYNLDSLKDDSIKYLYQQRLKQKLNREERTIEEEYEFIKRCIKEAAEEALGKLDKRKKPYWWDKEIEKQIVKKKELHLRRLQDSNNIQLQEEYRTLNREVKKHVANKMNETWIKKCEYIERYIGGTSSSEAWRIIRLSLIHILSEIQ